ncbi:MAG: hypothetical protein AAF211_00515 [Myxococcota bacterium]
MSRIVLSLLGACTAEPPVRAEPEPPDPTVVDVVDEPEERMDTGRPPVSCGEDLESGEFCAGVFTVDTPREVPWLPLHAPPSPYSPLRLDVVCEDLDQVALDYDETDGALVWTGGAAGFRYRWTVGVRDDDGWAPPGTRAEVRVALHRALPDGRLGIHDLVIRNVSAEELADGIVLDITQEPYNDDGLSTATQENDDTRWDLRVLWVLEVEPPPGAALTLVPEDTELRIWTRVPTVGG